MDGLPVTSHSAFTRPGILSAAVPNCPGIAMAAQRTPSGRRTPAAPTAGVDADDVLGRPKERLALSSST